MSATAAELPSAAPSPRRPARRLHPWPVRIMHWTNALAMLIMIGSGWGIYNDSVIFSAKWITALEVTNTYPGGYWEDLGFNWHSGL